MRPTLLETPFVKARDVSRYLAEAVTFMIKNPVVVLKDERLRDIESQRLFSNTPMSRIFQGLASAGKLNQFLFLDYSSLKGTGIPEVLISDDLCIDGRAIQTFQVPAIAQKCWINLTPILGKRDSYNSPLFFTDLSRLTQLVGRAAFVQAYRDKDLWLTIKQSILYIKLYSTIVSQTLSNAYNLDPDERKFITTLLAIYAAQLVGPEHCDPKRPPLLMRCSFLGSNVDIIKVLESIQPYIANKDGWMTLNDVVEIIRNIGPSRMKNLSVKLLLTSLSVSSVDSSTMIIAADYPPYWLFQLVNVASGYKNPVISGITKTFMSLERDLRDLADDVADNPNLLSALNR